MASGGIPFGSNCPNTRLTVVAAAAAVGNTVAADVVDTAAACRGRHGSGGWQCRKDDHLRERQRTSNNSVRSDTFCTAKQ